MNSPAHRFTALDSLRGIAALGVAWHHIVATSGPASWRLFLNGGLFVDFFFVLSGFVITATYGERLAQGFSLLRYGVLRLGRVWPLHAVMVFAGLALELLSLVVGQYGLSAEAPFQGLRDPLHFFTSLFLIDSWIPDWTNHYSRASWSISVEIVLYALAAMAFRQGRAGMVLFWLLTIAALVAMQTGFEAPLATAPMQRGLTEFAAGMACFYLHRRFEGTALRYASALEFVSLASLFAVITWAPPGYPTLATIVPSFAVILIFARQQGVIGRMFGTNPWVWLGQISYALYMVHAMVKGRAIDLLVLLGRATGRTMSNWTNHGGLPVKQLVLGTLPSTAVQIAIIGLMLITAHFAHIWIEEPARLASRRYAGRL